MSEHSIGKSYQPPVAKLLRYGEAKATVTENWPDYVATFGFTEAHVPELIRMMGDDELWNSDSESLEVWSNVHAWRALGQLKVVEAIEPMLSLLSKYEDDDWVRSEAPSVFKLIGGAAIPILADYLADESYNEWARCAAAEGIQKICENEPEFKDEGINILIKQLEAYETNGVDVNSMLVTLLLDLRVVEAAPLMEKVYASKKIDDLLPGTWATAQIELGLKDPSEFTPDELEPRFFKNLRASRLIANPEFEDSLPPPSNLLDKWDESPSAPTRFGEGFLELPKQQVTKSVKGFGQGSSDATKGKKKKKK